MDSEIIIATFTLKTDSLHSEVIFLLLDSMAL